MATLDTDEMIELIRQTPQLWDRGNRFHSNRQELDKCWKKIAMELNIEENRIRRKWKYLRDQFSVEFGKIPPIGSKAEMYEPKWRYYKLLQFLEEVVTPRVNTKNLRREDDSGESTSSFIRDSPSPVETKVKARHIEQPEAKKRKVRYTKDREKAKSPPDSVNEEHLHFFKSLLPHVRTIPPHLQLSFRNRVQEVVEEFAYRPDPTAITAADDFTPNETFFITCVPDHSTKVEPPEIADDCHDNQGLDTL